MRRGEHAPRANATNAAAGRAGGLFDLPREAALEPELKQAKTARPGGAREFIFDVQGHFVDPTGAWIKDAAPDAFRWPPKSACARASVARAFSHLECLGPDECGPGSRGYFLSDAAGTRFIEKARALGVKTICVHKGLPFGRRSYEHSQCSDIGVVASRFPDVNFLVYHSGLVTSRVEQAYAPGANADGDTLIASLEESHVKPGRNVYAELGSTWRFLMCDPEQAAHALGKLLKYCGEGQHPVGHGLHLVARRRTRSRPSAPSGSPSASARASATRRSPPRSARRSSD